MVYVGVNKDEGRSGPQRKKRIGKMKKIKSCVCHGEIDAQNLTQCAEPAAQKVHHRWGLCRHHHKMFLAGFPIYVPCDEHDELEGLHGGLWKKYIRNITDGRLIPKGVFND